MCAQSSRCTTQKRAHNLPSAAFRKLGQTRTGRVRILPDSACVTFQPLALPFIFLRSFLASERK